MGVEFGAALLQEALLTHGQLLAEGWGRKVQGRGGWGGREGTMAVCVWGGGGGMWVEVVS